MCACMECGVFTFIKINDFRKRAKKAQAKWNNSINSINGVVLWFQCICDTRMCVYAIGNFVVINTRMIYIVNVTFFCCCCCCGFFSISLYLILCHVFAWSIQNKHGKIAHLLCPMRAPSHYFTNWTVTVIWFNFLLSPRICLPLHFYLGVFRLFECACACVNVYISHFRLIYSIQTIQ